ncbi:MAG: hypothetical protein VR64_19125 [Desulfatitalea sp. BRH_c12]|nr:MAG: hypothetical protein VR64_19125 [Desulfatitalea sp. BRH_c12]
MATLNKKIVHTVFEDIAEKFPTRPAIQHAGREISYGELNRLSDDIARWLKQAGVKRDVIVGIVLESSIDYVAAIIGVMKAGGVFLPLDMSFPEKRLDYILSTTVPEVIISEKAFAPIGQRLAAVGFRHEACPVILIDRDLRVALRGDDAQTPAPTADSGTLPDPDDSCYIIYTSGSTGMPKAIEGCYKSLSHFVHWEVKEFGFDERVRVTQLPPVTFDASLRDIFVPLISGGMLCIPDKEIRTNMQALIQWMETAGVTLVHCVPSLFRMITREIEQAAHTGKAILPALRYVLMAGEPLYGKDVIRWMDLVGERVTLVNLYGPSETTLVKTFHPIRQRPANPNAMIPVGQPIANTAILITKANRLCEPGEIGDIFIKTPFRTKGYYHDPDLTKTCFVPNPLTGDADDIVYKTGDMGRYLVDRSVEFIGRLDTQVKVNGIRIELGEIERTLLGNACIDQAVVLGQRSRDNETTLVCYYTEKQPTDAGAVSAWLRLALPAYMVPSFYVRLDAFPLNINGKIDRKALPKPEELIYEGIAYAAPADDTEAVLAGIWSEVLHLKKVGVNSPFFQIGGHSLTATRVLSRIYRELGIEISLKDFFANQTVRELAALLRTPAQSGFMQIAPLAPQADYALSPSQRRLWILDRMEEAGATAYSLPGLFMVAGHFDIPAFQQAFSAVIARHESLRTTFLATDAGPRQKVHAAADALDFPIGHIDLSQALDGEQRAVQYASEQAAIPFDLCRGPLLRVAVMTLAGGRHAIFLNMHHIIGDAWSLDILARDVLAIYDAFRKGRDNPLAPLRVQYRDYAAWQNTRLEAPETQAMSAYWREKLSGAGTSVLDLPLDFPRPRLQTYMGENVLFSLDERPTAGLNALAQTHDASMFMIVLALVKTLLHRYTGQQDIVVGSPVACRNHPDLEDQIGFYANTLALRDHIDGRASFAAVLEKVKKTTIDAFDHQHYPFDRLVDDLDLARDPGRAPLFDVMVVYREEEKTANQDAPLAITAVEIDAGTSRFDLTFEITQSAGTLRIALNYNTDLFRSATIARMATHFSMLTEAILTDAGTAIQQLDMLAPAEKRLLTETFNDTRAAYPADKTLVDLFEDKVAKSPDHIAVILKEGALSYRELHERSRDLARVLVAKYRVRPQEIVGLMVDRNEWSIVGLLGIMMAGAAYLPVDASYPGARIDYMLADSGCRVLLSEEKYIGSAGRIASSVTTVGLETVFAAFDRTGADQGLPPRPAPDSLAYVIYTSGSTGLPKGVLIEHAGFVNMALDQIRTFGVAAQDRVLQFASASFDAALSEVFMALLAGAAVVVVPKETIDDPQAFLQYLEAKKVTHATLPPAYLTALDKKGLTTVTTIITAGEAPNTEDALFLSRSKQYFNAYGPTEISVCATIARVAPDGDYRRTIPIGRPIANTAIYILDDDLKLVPIGIPGEICISGPGLARGYLNKPELSAEKFVAHPFQVGQRLYRTGDLGRWRFDGTVEWLGRNDDQVKIRGYRIELGEIKNALLRHTAVKDAIVLAGDRTTGELSAYFTARERLEPAALRAYLGQSLPHYMLPAVCVQLETLPLTVHGKVDRKALAQAQAPRPCCGTASADPRNALEEWMLALWREVLGNQAIGIHDNFFESGGNSLRSLQLISRMATRSGHLNVGKVPVKLLFLHPSVAELCLAIEKPRPLTSAPTWASGNVLPQSMSLAREPLLALFDAGRIAPVDAAAIICLPDGLIDRTALAREEIIKGFCGDRPVLSSITTTFMGRVAAIVLPCFASEIFSDQGALNTHVADALTIAGHIGAGTVSLTGNLPLATDFGLDLAPHAAAGNGTVITTGQATVAAAMGMTIEKMLNLSDRRLDHESIGLIGVNTIGAATLFLMLECMPHPKRIILADAYNNLFFASVLRQELYDCGFTGTIDIMQASDTLPAEFYEASLLIGATNVPDIITVDQVQPGTILIEESGQRCFSRDDALRRLERDGDILFTEGDLLRLPFATTCQMYLPAEVEAALRHSEALSLLAFEPRAITGCILSGLLTHRYADLEPTIGEVDGPTCLRHYNHLHSLRFTVADPQCEGYAVPETAIQKFRGRFGASRLLLSKGEATA